MKGFRVGVEGVVWHFPPYLLLLLVGTGLALALAALVWWQYPAPGSKPFALLMVALALWQGFRVLEGAATITADKVFWAKLEYLGIAAAPLLWLLFAWAYSGRLRPFSRRVLVLLWLLPALTMPVAFTNERHGLLWTRITRTSPAPDALPVYEHGTWFWGITAYNYLLLLIGTAIIVWTTVRFPVFYRRHVGLILVGVAAPWVANVLYLTRRFPVRGLDPTPLALTLTGLVAFWVLFRSRLFDLLPVARELLIERMTDGVIVFDAHGHIVDRNPAALRLLPAAQSLAIGTPARDALAATPALVALAGRDDEGRTELHTGDDGYLDARIAPLLTERGDRRGMLLLLRDISVQKRSEDRLRAANVRLAEQLAANEVLHSRLHDEATRDPLTGLFNRRYLREALTHALDRAAQDGQPLSVVLLDLDHFKQVNDHHGHAAGDWVLETMSTLLRTQTRDEDIVCRYGGEEFVAVLPGADTSAARVRTEQWRRELGALHVHFAGGEARVTLSAGVATYPADGLDHDALLGAADRALYRAKQTGRNRVVTAVETIALSGD